jgi:hypothetical protein
MRTFHLSLNLNNDAFIENQSTELVTCLDQAARQITERNPELFTTPGAYPIQDTNGNTVGSWRIVLDENETESMILPIRHSPVEA